MAVCGWAGSARHGSTGYVNSWQAWSGRQGASWFGMAGVDGSGKVNLVKVRQNMAGMARLSRYVKTRSGMAGKARQDEAGNGSAEHGRHGLVGNGASSQGRAHYGRHG